MVRERLHQLHAVVTGGSRGIGRAVAERFVADGAVVAINHPGDEEAASQTLASLHRIDREEGRAPRDHLVVKADVSDEAAVRQMVAQVVAQWGRLDCMVCNAGIQSVTEGHDFDLATFQRILDVNLNGVALCAREAIAHFLSREGGGTVIATSSVHQLIPKPTYLAYAASKGALGQMVRTLALEYADRGIRVNAVAPGAVTTDINAAWIDDPKARAGVESHIPMGFAADASQIAPLYAFLASEDSVYVTGQTLYACGGLTLFGEFKQNWSS
jgi:glucose 1-dehydrogenase